MANPPFRVTPATLDVIEVLLSGDDELYGLRIAKRAKRPTGSVAPILMRLENCGWATSYWETETDRRRLPRRFYRLHDDHVADARDLVNSRGRGAKTNPKPEHRGLAQRIAATLGMADTRR